MHFREYEVTPFGVRAVLIYVDGMQEEQLIDTHVLQVLMSDAAQDAEQKPKRPPEELASYFKEKRCPSAKLPK
ncbi:hypothetical protein HMSSN036_00950 [Paenibacillus macerans]|nr:hypothetical protein HMSSN036_00950 [Paenibacillus macerans]